ncbi:hypothetical protein COA01_15775 [Bacillus cereus]|uniref:DUF4121 family protein n=1 Tax=Bacillus cereus TaxID=1396 RepID=UPI000BFBE819|nr:DUF4121 family protein [Bacillus cereus]PGP20996.1 hypothetical protein COA01_15775 [Bacillus cereus]
MNKYTIESLKVMPENATYDYHHQINQFDADKANELVKAIENSRNDKSPQVGDIVEFTNKHGEYYANAHIDKLQEDGLDICERPSNPFVSVNESNDSIHTSTGGGAWTVIPTNLTYVGKKERRFLAVGHNGLCGDGAFTFIAEVNVWEYQECDLTYTTKTHDKFYVSIREDEDSAHYKYVITKDGLSNNAFKTDEEYQAWLKTYHGVEKDGAWTNTKIVWTYKQKSETVSLREYLNIEDAVIDSELRQGTIQECKRIYEGTSVTTFLPVFKDAIELVGEKRYKKSYN